MSLMSAIAVLTAATDCESAALAPPMTTTCPASGWSPSAIDTVGSNRDAVAIRPVTFGGKADGLVLRDGGQRENNRRAGKDAAQVVADELQRASPDRHDGVDGESAVLVLEIAGQTRHAFDRGEAVEIERLLVKLDGGRQLVLDRRAQPLSELHHLRRLGLLLVEQQDPCRTQRLRDRSRTSEEREGRGHRENRVESSGACQHTMPRRCTAPPIESGSMCRSCRSCSGASPDRNDRSAALVGSLHRL